MPYSEFFVSNKILFINFFNGYTSHLNESLWLFFIFVLSSGPPFLPIFGPRPLVPMFGPGPLLPIRPLMPLVPPVMPIAPPMLRFQNRQRRRRVGQQVGTATGHTSFMQSTLVISVTTSLSHYKNSYFFCALVQLDYFLT